MKHLLVVAHDPSPNTQRMVEAVLAEHPRNDGALWLEIALDRNDWARIAAAESVAVDAVCSDQPRVAGAG